MQLPTKDEVISALGEVNSRLQGLADQIKERPDTNLLSGTWTVRDTLCHLAARSNGVPTFITRLERLATATTQPAAAPAAMNIDEVNQSQLDARQGRSAEQLMEEIRAGHVAAIDGVKQLDESTFSRVVPNFRGEHVEAGNMLLGSTARHDNTHLDEIEKALTG